MNLYAIWLLFYISLAIVSQFLTSTPIELLTVFGVSIWLPLSALTIIPMVDVARSFTQNQAEKQSLAFKVVGFQMMTLTMLVSGLCVVFAGLPLPIFVGVLLAATFGGAIDILVFRRMGKFFKSPVKRMAVSNAFATLLGSGIVFLVAFTDIIFTQNPMARPYFDATIGWLTQSTFIWLSGLLIAWSTTVIGKSFTR